LSVMPCAPAPACSAFCTPRHCRTPSSASWGVSSTASATGSASAAAVGAGAYPGGRLTTGDRHRPPHPIPGRRLQRGGARPRPPCSAAGARAAAGGEAAAHRGPACAARQ
jgi:hypothetical protein